MKEKDFQTKFTRWLKDNWEENAAFELKFVNLAKKKALPYSEIKKHQIKALQLANKKKLVYKIPDVGMCQKPFDCFCLGKVPAFLVIMYWKKSVDWFYMIEYSTLIKEMRLSKTRSISEEKAMKIGSVYNLS